MTGFLDAVRAARLGGDWGPVADSIPYLRFMGIGFQLDGGVIVGTMRYAPGLVGNFSLPALHGGTLGALLESTAIVQCLQSVDELRLPRTISLTIDYLRPARPIDTHARATVTRAGKRVANVRGEAFQDDPGRPVATVNALFLIGGEAA